VKRHKSRITRLRSWEFNPRSQRNHVDRSIHSYPALTEKIRMRLVFTSVYSWLVGLATMWLGFSLSPAQGISTLNGPRMASLIATAFVYSLAYGPSLSWLKTRRSELGSASVFPLTSALILNLPVFLIVLLAIGRTLLAAEAYALMISFATMGASFGLGFVLSSPRPRGIRDKIRSHPITAGKQALASRAN